MEASVSHEFNFDLSRYSAVRIGYSYRSPLLNTVANAQFRTVLTAMRNVIELGYERICTLLTKEVDQRTSWQFLGGYLAGIHLLPKKNWFDPFYVVPGEHWQPSFFEWLEKHRIDCVVGAGFGYICHDMIKRGDQSAGGGRVRRYPVAAKRKFFHGHLSESPADRRGSD